jgi:hypothetical protein
MPKQACKFCGNSGHPGYVISPGGLWQRCPACDGTGVEPPVPLFFEYELDLTLTANEENLVGSVQVNDKDFKWIFAMAQSTGAFSALVTDGSSKRQFSNVALHQNVLFGTAQQPFPLPAPFTFQKRGAILVSVNDLSGAGNTVRLCFGGVELAD